MQKRRANALPTAKTAHLLLTFKLQYKQNIELWLDICLAHKPLFDFSIIHSNLAS